ncbi:hypothetical protein BDW74DRAFT_167427 [Aspergillus multicolor]|uniref:uncharacterized protein n=1 Tax=Aspergillus multicolor TaxID=41759 RepID=UPI003CCD6949
MLGRRHTCEIGHLVRPRPSRSYRVALIGLGYRGYRTHFLSLVDNPSISIAAVCDTSRTALEAFSSKHSTIPSYQSLNHLLSNHDLDFAIISTPHVSHMELILTAAKSGIHVLKEKPIAETVEDYQRMLSLPIRIGVMFQKRFEDRSLHFRSLLPLVGKVAAISANLALNITNLEETWRATSGVGVTEDLGCHMIDLLVWLFGTPTSVMAHKAEAVRPLQTYGGDDVCHILMDWRPMNCIGHIRLSRVAHRAGQSITVTGTNGTLTLDGDAITLFNPEGNQVIHEQNHSVDKAMISSMVQGFGDWVTGCAADFRTSLTNVEGTVYTMDAIKASLASRQPQHPATPKSAPNRRPNVSVSGQPRSIGPAAGFSTSCRTHRGQSSFILSTGSSIPAVGLGTRRARWPGQIYEAVLRALETGYRHIDTAQSSGNEHEIGRAIQDSGIPRSAIWITTKLDSKWHSRVGLAFDMSLNALGTDYVDLYLMHWPISIDPSNPNQLLEGWTFVDTWRDMQSLSTTKVRNIGVSNFGISHLQTLLNEPSCTTIPAVNQVELHPYWPSPTLLKYCSTRRIHSTAYACLGSVDSPLVRDPAVLAISQRIGVSPQQVLIRWGIQRGTSVVPNSTNDARIMQNLEALDWELTEVDMEVLSQCTTRFKSCQDEWLPGKVFMVEDT